MNKIIIGFRFIKMQDKLILISYLVTTLIIINYILYYLGCIWNYFFKKEDRYIKMYDFIEKNKYDETFIDILQEFYFINFKPGKGNLVEIIENCWRGKNGYITKIYDDQTLDICIPKYLNNGNVPKTNKTVRKKMNEIKLT